MESLPRILELLVTPPGVIVLMMLLTFLGYIRSHWLGTVLLSLTLVALIILSLPLTAHSLMKGLQTYAKPLELVPLAESGPQAALHGPKDNLKDLPQAIVVLGAGRYSSAPEYDDRDTVTGRGLERLRYAAHLQRLTGLPVLVSGGAPGGESAAEADFMRQALVDDFRVNVKWLERESRSTRENARLSAALLAENKVKHVYLVTHAWHMRRAAGYFESFGIHVTPAPTGFHTLSRQDRLHSAYLPSSQGMERVSLALHERLAYLWYELRGEELPPAAPAPAK
jgi:uncharacterized SAM-binding protein YcdF (DUF218 family)